MTPIYLDNNATTRVDPVVVEAMLPFFTEHFGNASSIHAFGSEVGKALKKARGQVQALLGAEHDSEIIFTSCGTESDSTAILSALKAQPERNTVITTTVEHPAILTLCEWLEKEGWGYFGSVCYGNESTGFLRDLVAMRLRGSLPRGLKSEHPTSDSLSGGEQESQSPRAASCSASSVV